MPNQSAEKYVTEKVFKKEIHGLHVKIDSSITRLDQKTSNLTLEYFRFKVVVEKRFDTMEGNMAAMENRLMDRLDFIAKKVSIFDQEESVQSFRLEEARRQLTDHETPLVKLESAQK